MAVAPGYTKACHDWARRFDGLETPRLYARRLTAADDQLLFEALQNPRVHSWVGTLEQPFTLSSARRWLAARLERMERDEGVYCGVFYQGTNALLGFVGAAIKAEHGGMTLGGAVSELYWGKGFAEEIMFALIADLLGAGVNPIYATTALENYASERLLLAFNFEEVGQTDIATPDGGRASRLFQLAEQDFRKAVITPDTGATPEEIREKRRALLRQCQQLKAKRSSQS